ncbi:MAG TPA: flagellar type III secretion system protein FliQ [Desulfotomaculum sp.]|nr:flagellar type III secretion system protein FliQ [Desulfotomaculum sp.]
MPENVALGMVNRAILMVLLVAGPILIVSMVVGLAISILQATTQIQDQMISFVPKILAVFLALMVFFPFYVRLLTGFANTVFEQFALIMR